MLQKSLDLLSIHLEILGAEVGYVRQRHWMLLVAYWLEKCAVKKENNSANCETLRDEAKEDSEVCFCLRLFSFLASFFNSRYLFKIKIMRYFNTCIGGKSVVEARRHENSDRSTWLRFSKDTARNYYL